MRKLLEVENPIKLATNKYTMKKNKKHYLLCHFRVLAEWTNNAQTWRAKLKINPKEKKKPPTKNTSNFDGIKYLLSKSEMIAFNLYMYSKWWFCSNDACCWSTVCVSMWIREYSLANWFVTRICHMIYPLVVSQKIKQTPKI